MLQQYSQEEQKRWSFSGSALGSPLGQAGAGYGSQQPGQTPALLVDQALHVLELLLQLRISPQVMDQVGAWMVIIQLWCCWVGA